MTVVEVSFVVWGVCSFSPWCPSHEEWTDQKKEYFLKNIFQNMQCQEISCRSHSGGFCFELIPQFSLKSVQLHGEVFFQHWISGKGFIYIHRIITWLPSFGTNVGGYLEISVSIQKSIALLGLVTWRSWLFWEVISRCESDKNTPQSFGIQIQTCISTSHNCWRSTFVSCQFNSCVSFLSLAAELKGTLAQN